MGDENALPLPIVGPTLKSLRVLFFLELFSFISSILIFSYLSRLEMSFIFLFQALSLYISSFLFYFFYLYISL